MFFFKSVVCLWNHAFVVMILMIPNVNKQTNITLCYQYLGFCAQFRWVIQHPPSFSMSSASTFRSAMIKHSTASGHMRNFLNCSWAVLTIPGRNGKAPMLDRNLEVIWFIHISHLYAKLIRLKTLNTLRNLRSVWLYIYISLWGQSGLPHAQCSPKIPFSSSWRPLHAAGGIVQGSHLGEGQSGPATRPLQWCV